MPTTNDELRLQVSASDYEAKIGVLDAKMNELQAILGEYRTLQSDAATQVLGESDDSIQDLKKSIEVNIKAIEGQWNLLNEQKLQLSKQEENMGILRTNVDNMFATSMQSAKTAFKTIKAVGDLADMVN